MEKEFIFLRLVSGTKKDGSHYSFLDYLNPSTFEPLRYWYNDKPIDFATLSKKLKKGDELKKFTGICGVDDKDHIYIKDVK